MNNNNIKVEHDNHAKLYPTGPTTVKPGFNQLRYHIAKVVCNPQNIIEIKADLAESYPPMINYNLTIFPRANEQETQSTLCRMNCNQLNDFGVTIDPENTAEAGFHRILAAYQSRVKCLVDIQREQQAEITRLQMQLAYANDARDDAIAKVEQSARYDSHTDDEVIDTAYLVTDEDTDTEVDLGYSTDEY